MTACSRWLFPGGAAGLTWSPHFSKLIECISPLLMFLWPRATCVFQKFRDSFHTMSLLKIYKRLHSLFLNVVKGWGWSSGHNWPPLFASVNQELPFSYLCVGHDREADVPHTGGKPGTQWTSSIQLLKGSHCALLRNCFWWHGSLLPETSLVITKFKTLQLTRWTAVRLTQGSWELARVFQRTGLETPIIKKGRDIERMSGGP